MSDIINTLEFAGPGGRLCAIDTGYGAGMTIPLVLVHGINMSSDVWADLVPLLATYRRVVALDLRGHGQSNRNGPFTPAGYSQDVLALMDHLNIERAHVVGTSFGGATACWLAANQPERVVSLTAIGSAMKVDAIDINAAVEAIRAVGLEAFFAQMLPAASFAPGAPQALIDRALGVATSGRDIDTVVAVSTAAFGSDVTMEARAVTAPSLVIAGELDATCPPQAGRAMAEALRGHYEEVPGVGHVLSMEAPRITVELINRHLADVDNQNE